MGMGEALANYNAAIGAIRRLVDPAPDGLGMSARGITDVDRRTRARRSTSSRPRASRSRWRCRCTPRTTSCATSWCPINTRWSVDEAIDAAYRYFETTRRRVSIEYALIRDINDQAWRADLLGER